MQENERKGGESDDDTEGRDYGVTKTMTSRGRRDKIPQEIRKIEELPKFFSLEGLP